VDDDEVLAVPVGVVAHPVAGDARFVLHDGGAATEDAVDERRFADVGTAHHSHHGLDGGLLHLGEKFFGHDVPSSVRAWRPPILSVSVVGDLLSTIGPAGVPRSPRLTAVEQPLRRSTTHAGATMPIH